MTVMIDAFLVQADWCQRLDSPFTAAVLRHLATGDLTDGGPLARRLTDWPADPVADAVALRVTGALHHLARSGLAPDLAAAYPPQTAGFSPATAAALAGAVEGHDAVWTEFLAGAPQTNEVRRSLGLLPAFLKAVSACPLPVDLYEIGASAGLNLCWDQYHYRGPGWQWGNPDSALTLETDWRGPPLTGPAVSVTRRQGCDINPIDITDPAARERLSAYLWADQPERLARMQAAAAIAGAVRPSLTAADAGAWLTEKLPERLPGHLTILYHSVVWQYLPEATKAACEAAIAAAAASATPEMPFAHVRFEPDGPGRFAVTLDLWPGSGQRRIIAAADPHGRWVEHLPG